MSKFPISAPRGNVAQRLADLQAELERLRPARSAHILTSQTTRGVIRRAKESSSTGSTVARWA